MAMKRVKLKTKNIEMSKPRMSPNIWPHGILPSFRVGVIIKALYALFHIYKYNRHFGILATGKQRLEHQ